MFREPAYILVVRLRAILRQFRAHRRRRAVRHVTLALAANLLLILQSVPSPVTIAKSRLQPELLYPFVTIHPNPSLKNGENLLMLNFSVSRTENS